MKSLFTALQYHLLTTPLELAKLGQLQTSQPVTDYLCSMYCTQRLKKNPLFTDYFYFFISSKMPISRILLTGWVSGHKFLIPFSGSETFGNACHHSVLQPTVYKTVRQMQSTMSSLTERWQIIHLLIIHILCCLFLDKLLISLSQKKKKRFSCLWILES